MDMVNDVIQFEPPQDTDRLTRVEHKLEVVNTKLDRIEHTIEDHCKEKETECEKCKAGINDKIAETLRIANNNLAKLIIKLIERER
jgi:tryptophanyl-tRNA synthetase